MPSRPFPFGFKLANLASSSLRSQVGGEGRIFTAVNQPRVPVSPFQIYPPPPLPWWSCIVWRPTLACAQTTSKPLRARRKGGKGGNYRLRGNMVSAPSVLHYLVLQLSWPDPSYKEHPQYHNLDINDHLPQREPCKGAEQHQREEIFKWTQPAKWKQRDIQVL